MAALFETVQTEKPNRLWKILPLAALVFAAIVALFFVLFQAKPVARDQITGTLRAGDPDFDWYSKYVSLRKPQVQMGKNFAGHRMVMFSGVIENNGEKALDVVEVKLIFFNYNTPVWETTRLAIRPGSGSYTPAIAPLEQRGFALYVQDIPEDWRATNAEMSLNGFRFKAD